VPGGTCGHRTEARHKTPMAFRIGVIFDVSEDTPPGGSSQGPQKSQASG